MKSYRKAKRNRHILLRTNIIIGIIVVVGFALTAIIGYSSNLGVSTENIEHVSRLTADGIYYQIAETFARPVSVSKTMAKDVLLKDCLKEERNHQNDPEYVATLADYLGQYKKVYGYESVFLVSDSSLNYYTSKGIDRVLEGPDDPENGWYYELKSGTSDFRLVIDNDQVAGAQNEITVFVNYRILDGDGTFLGTVGVGMVVDHFQKLLSKYEADYGVKVSLLNRHGIVKISPTRYDYGEESVDWFHEEGYSDDVRSEVLSFPETGDRLELWLNSDAGSKEDFLLARYFSDIEWLLIVEQNTGRVISRLNRVLLRNCLIVLGIIALILTTVAVVVCKYDRRVRELSRAAAEARRSALEQFSCHLFENIYELDISHDRAANSATEEYFETLGVPKKTPFHRTLEIIAEKQIEEEYRSGYIETFTPENVKRSYAAGKDFLTYEFRILGEKGDYHWMRIVGQIVPWTDGSLHMYSYRQNIDAEKMQEDKLRKLARLDSMTGFLNKAETARRIEKVLRADPHQKRAFLIIDIDNFKTSNDRFGHAYGDSVIMDFTSIIRLHFRSDDILGRIGGDEFVIFCAYKDLEELRSRAEDLTADLSRLHEEDGKTWRMSASLGIALAPEHGIDFASLYKKADQALYETKERGKNGYTLYDAH